MTCTREREPGRSTAAQRLLSFASAVSSILCAVSIVLWLLSMGPLKGDHRGSHWIIVDWGKLWVGPIWPSGEIPIREEGWDILVASCYRCLGDRGTHWKSFHI